MAKAKSVFTINGVDSVPTGNPFVFYQKGTDAYEGNRVNADVKLQLDNGQEIDAKIQHLQVGALIDLIAGSGAASVNMVGRLYSPLGIVQALTDAAPEAVLDVTKLYTALSVIVPYAPPSA